MLFHHQQNHVARSSTFQPLLSSSLSLPSSRLHSELPANPSTSTEIANPTHKPQRLQKHLAAAASAVAVMIIIAFVVVVVIATADIFTAVVIIIIIVLVGCSYCNCRLVAVVVVVITVALPLLFLKGEQ